MTSKLVTYGTLMHPMWGLEFIHYDTMSGDMYNLGGFPAVTTTGDTGNEFYYQVAQITPDLLPQLDRYEGVADGLYRRETVDTPVGPAYIYIFNRELPEGAQLINDWRGVR